MNRKNNLVYITYDFLNGQPTDTFNVAADISDVFGNRVHESALSGDIGNNVSGGEMKTIIWNLNVDRIYMEDDIDVQILARNRLPPGNSRLILISENPSVEFIPEKSEVPKSSAETSVKRSAETTVKSFSRSGIVIQSLVLPGLGLSRVKRKPHWLRGLAGYGCLAGSIYFNQEAINKLNDISNSNKYGSFEEREDLFARAITMDEYSEWLAYAAISIWVIDFIWTVAGSSELSKNSAFQDLEGFSIKGGLDPLTYAPTLGITYRF